MLFKEIFEFKSKSKLQASEGNIEGKYRFFTSSNAQTKYINKSTYEGESLIFGTGGNASVHFCSEKFSSSTDCFVVQTKINNIKTKFIYYFFIKNFNILEKGFKGAGLKHISKEYLSNIQIPLPPLSEQKQIVKILDKADSIRQKRKQAIDLLDEYLRSTFLEMFGDPIKNEKKWRKKILNEVCLKITDGTHFSPPIIENGIPYITAKHIRENKIDFWSNPWFVSKEHHDKIYKRCDPKKGDILYIKDGATTGCAAINKYDFEFSMLSSLALIRCNPMICSSEYLCFWLNNPTIKKNILKDMIGGAIKRLTLVKILKIPVNIPSLTLQNQFAEIVQKVESVKFKMQESLKEMNNHFNSLSNKFFNN